MILFLFFEFFYFNIAQLFHGFFFTKIASGRLINNKASTPDPLPIQPPFPILTPKKYMLIFIHQFSL